MGFYTTTLEPKTAPRKTPSCSPKTTSRKFFSYPIKTSHKNSPNSLKTSLENPNYSYKIASGRSSWPSRDPIEEDGGVNLYAFVGNDPIGRWDILGARPGDGIDNSPPVAPTGQPIPDVGQNDIPAFDPDVPDPGPLHIPDMNPENFPWNNMFGPKLKKGQKIKVDCGTISINDFTPRTGWWAMPQGQQAPGMGINAFEAEFIPHEPACCDCDDIKWMQYIEFDNDPNPQFNGQPVPRPDDMKFGNKFRDTPFVNALWTRNARIPRAQANVQIRFRLEAYCVDYDTATEKQIAGLYWGFNVSIRKVRGKFVPTVTTQ